MEYESPVMTQQATIVLEPPALRFAIPEPEVVDLLRPIQRRKPTNMRYVGLKTISNRHKYAGDQRVRIAGGEARLLSDREIAEWHKRLGRIMSGETEVRREPL
jgi:hypothetical protein